MRINGMPRFIAVLICMCIIFLIHPQTAPAQDDKPQITLPGRPPAQLKVPNVVGLQGQEAVKRLQAAGFKYKHSTVGMTKGEFRKFNSFTSIVKRQSPAAGATAKAGTFVVLYHK